MPFGAAVGYNVQDFSFDLSYTRITQKEKDTGEKGKSNFYLANGYYNFPVSSNIVKPYAGAGIGLVQTKDVKETFAYQVAVGSKFNVHEHVQLFADLRYTGTGKAKDKEDSSVKAKFSYYSVNAGISYLF